MKREVLKAHTPTSQRPGRVKNDTFWSLRLHYLRGNTRKTYTLALRASFVSGTGGGIIFVLAVVDRSVTVSGIVSSIFIVGSYINIYVYMQNVYTQYVASITSCLPMVGTSTKPLVV